MIVKRKSLVLKESMYTGPSDAKVAKAFFTKILPRSEVVSRRELSRAKMNAKLRPYITSGKRTQKIYEEAIDHIIEHEGVPVRSITGKAPIRYGKAKFRVKDIGAAHDASQRKLNRVCSRIGAVD